MNTTRLLAEAKRQTLPRKNWQGRVVKVIRTFRFHSRQDTTSSPRVFGLGGVLIVATALCFLSSIIVFAVDQDQKNGIDVDELYTTQLSDPKRSLFCIHTPDEIFAVVAVKLPKNYTSSESHAGVQRDDKRSSHGTAWAKYRWNNQALRIEFSTKLPEWIRLNGQRFKLSAGRVLYWSGGRLFGQSEVLNGGVPQPNVSDPKLSQRLAEVRQSIMATFPADVSWDAEAMNRVLQQRRLNGRRFFEVRGTILDAETGERIKRRIAIQGGRWHGDLIRWSDHPNGSVVTDHGDGTFDAPLFEWTSRVVVDGYLPKVILEELPSPDENLLEVVLKLDRAPTISGRVLNHLGEPVAGASVFSVGPMGLNLRGGLEWQAIGGVRQARAKPVITDQDGRFRGLGMQPSRRIAVSCKEFDIWPAKVANGQTTIEIRLPQPATMRIDYDIPGGPEMAKVEIYALDLDEPWKSLRNNRVIDIALGSSTTMAALPAGRYHIKRFAAGHWTPHESGWLDQEFVELKPGDVHVFDWTRSGPGAQVKGRMTWDKEVKDLLSVYFKVTSTIPNKHFNGTKVTRNLDAGDVHINTGEFLTEKLPVGDYTLEVHTTQRVGTNREFFGNRRMAGTVLHNESFSFPFTVRKGINELDLKDIRLNPAKDPRGDALRKRDAERARVKKTP